MWVRVYHHIRVGERVGVQGIIDVIICMCVNHGRGGGTGIVFLFVLVLVLVLGGLYVVFCLQLGLMNG